MRTRVCLHCKAEVVAEEGSACANCGNPMDTGPQVSKWDENNPYLSVDLPSDGGSADDITSNPADAHCTPRLSLVHVLLWGLCSLVHLGTARTISNWQGLPYMPIGAFDLLSAANGGAVFMGAIVLAERRYRANCLLVRHPGHLLLVVSVALSVILMATWFLRSALGESPPFRAGAIPVLAMVIYAYNAMQCRTNAWRTALFVIAFAFIIRIISNHAWQFGVPLVVLAVAGLDLTRVRRDWLHWLGIATYLFNHAINVWVLGSL